MRNLDIVLFLFLFLLLDISVYQNDYSNFKRVTIWSHQYSTAWLLIKSLSTVLSLASIVCICHNVHANRHNK